MSGYSPGPVDGAGSGLDNLFAQLRQQQSKPVKLEPSYSYYGTGNNNYLNGGQSQQPHGYQQPSVSSPIPTPPIYGAQPHHSSAIMSPAETPQPRMPPAVGNASNSDRTSSLLNLLKFSQPSAGSPAQSAPIGTPLPKSREASVSYAGSDAVGRRESSGHGRGNSDLLAALMGNVQSKPTQSASPQFPTNNQPQSTFSANATSPPADTQAYLLQLLNQPKPAQSDSTPQLRHTKVTSPPSKPSSQDDIGDLSQALEDASLDMSMMGSAATENLPSFGKENARESTSKNMFTYVNPFEQLAASSPRKRTPKNATASPSNAPTIQILKHPRHDSPDERSKADDKSSISSPAHTKRKLEPVSQSSSAPPTPLPDGRTQIEALIGIGSSKETVHDALHDVGDQVDKEVQEAIARAERDESEAAIEKEMRDMLAAKTQKEFEHHAQAAAQSIKKELDKEENSHALDSLPAPVADDIRDTIDDVAQGHIADSWESADADDGITKDEEESLVKVFNFPMRPWTSITIKESEESRPVFRDEVVMDIARVKKEFDQIDRTLVTASNNFIVYGMSKHGGIRIIRQDDGKDAKLFTETHDRIFSVVTSVSTAEMKESIIATGISGTVYWALIKEGEGDHIEDSSPEMYGFALPPLQSQDTESPGGVLKTRARKSSTHPEFFAVGRGKHIHVIWPSVVMKQSHLKNGKDRVVDAEKYLKQQSLKINTGKAGKDFTFSEDDTTIVSLDKAGKVKFWDVRSLTGLDDSNKPVHGNIEIKEPLVTFVTTPVSEKSWPTSVLFVDKLRPYQRGGALRYLIVGMKQNHTLQLWDLALGKPVQEIHLPHTKESDAVCSVMYHAATGMVVVGHPTRNSIYFLHLSAPKYNLPKSISQADYIEKLVANDPAVPKPESTAVISGMREYSFANKGSLRSLDILQTPNSASAGVEPVTMFELYAMHSKGVTCLNVKQADLGWTSDNKVIHPVVAERAGVISIDTLKEIPAPAASDAGEASTSQPSIPTRIVPRAAKEATSKESPKKVSAEPVASPSKVDDKADKKDNTRSNGGAAPSSWAEKSEKKKRRKGASSSETPVHGPSGTQDAQPAKPIVLDPSSNARNGSASKANLNAIPEASAARIPQDLAENASKNVESRVASEIKKLLKDSIESLNQNIKTDRRVQAEVFEAKQDAMLRIVSSTLSDNIEATLGRIVSSSIKESVIPVISDVSSKAINDQLGSKLNSHLSQNLPKELQRALPDALGKALQHPQLLKLISESLAKSVAFRVEEHFTTLMHNVVTPAFKTLAVQTSQRVAGDVQRQASEQIAIIERQRHADSIKIEQLTQLVTSLTETVSSMAGAQSEFQGQFLRMQQQAVMDRRQPGAHQTDQGTVRSVSRPSTALTVPVRTAEEIEFDEMLSSITRAMNAGEFESAVIQWLQTRREQEFFAKYFSKFNPDFIRDLTPLLLLSLGATISMDFDGELLSERIAWLDMILLAFQAHVTANTLEDQVRDLIPKIMGIYVQRLEHLFMRVSQISAQDPILKTLAKMVTSANRILETSREIDVGRR